MPAKKTKETPAPPALASTADEKPASRLLVSISGIRGISGESLTAAQIVPFVDAFARMTPGSRIVLGHDARPSARWITPLVEAVLRSLGKDVIELGLATTPTVGLATRKLKAGGGIAVTASHNPIEYNGLKFFHSGGEFITAEMLDQLNALRASSGFQKEPVKIGKKAVYTDAPELHLHAIQQHLPEPKLTKKGKKLKVLLDCCNSTGAEIAPLVVDAFGGLFQLINSDVTKYSFPRGPEPTEKNIAALRRAVVKEKADLGFAIDPDGDRLALVDEKGIPLGEERTLLLAADAYLSLVNKRTPIVVNLSTSVAIDALAQQHKIKVFRTAIGEANVLAGIRLHKAKLGGEGNGGVIVPAIQPGRDAATAIALVLLGLQARGGTLSQWNASHINPFMDKVAFPIDGLPLQKIIERFRKEWPKAQHDTTDGIKIILGDRWIHLRPSNTEPIVRVFAEGPTAGDVDELISKAEELLK